MCLPTDPAIPLKLIHGEEIRRNPGKQGHTRVLTAVLFMSARKKKIGSGLNVNNSNSVK